jgi:AP-3 complex subunit beta
MRAFLFPAAGQENNKMLKHAKKIFLATKPAPVTESRFKDRDVFQLGSMSHFLNTRVPGYHDLPSYPEVAPGNQIEHFPMNFWVSLYLSRHKKEFSLFLLDIQC